MASVQSGYEVIPVDEVERYRDAEWALHDPEVQRTYHGRWVVAYRRRVIAEGTNPNEALAQADLSVKEVKHIAVYCAIETPTSLLGHTSEIGP